MPSRKLHRRIRDILETITEIESFVEEMSLSDFKQDPKTVKAVLYHLALCTGQKKETGLAKGCRKRV